MRRFGAFILRYAEPCELAIQLSDTRCETQTQTRVRAEAADSDAQHTLPRHHSAGSSGCTETITKVQGEGRDAHPEKNLRAIPLPANVTTSTVTEVKPEECDVNAITNNLTAVPQTAISGEETITAVKGEGRDVHYLSSQFAALPACH